LVVIDPCEANLAEDAKMERSRGSADFANSDGRIGFQPVQ
jgi:hypothetical protein